MTCQLYRYYDDQGCLLYVGISLSAVKRASQHKSESHWYCQAATITIENCKTRIEAEKKEIAAIRKEMPKYNVVHNYGGANQVPRRISRNMHEDLKELNDVNVSNILSEIEAKNNTVKNNMIAMECELRSARSNLIFARKRLRRYKNATDVLNARIITTEHVLWQMVNDTPTSRPHSANQGLIRRSLAYIFAMSSKTTRTRQSMT